VLDIRGEEDSGDVGVVGLEVGDGNELGFLALLNEMPDIDVALLVISRFLWKNISVWATHGISASTKG
jgi:hypothetical protein